MRKTLLLTSLFLSLGLYAQEMNINSESLDVKEASDMVSNQEESLSQQYYNNQSNQEATHNSCESKKTGTYMQYHSNGMLKSFSIVE